MELGLMREPKAGEVNGYEVGESNKGVGLVVVDGLVQLAPVHVPFLQAGDNRAELGGVRHGGGVGRERGRGLMGYGGLVVRRPCGGEGGSGRQLGGERTT